MYKRQVIYRTKSIAYAATLVWSYLAVFFGQTNSAVQATALLYAAVAALAGAWAISIRSRGTQIPEEDFEVDEQSMLLDAPGSGALLPSPDGGVASGVFASVPAA